VLIAIIAAGAYFAIQQSTPTTTTGMTSQSGQPVPNTDTLVEESSREAGPGGYDPAYTWGSGGDNVFSNVYEHLVTWDGNNMTKFIPWLATSLPEVSPDGLVYTIHLRQGITFQDGTPFNASAVKFNIDRDILMNPADGPQYMIAAQETMAIKGGPRYFAANTVGVYNETEVNAYLAAGGVKVIDTYTVQITLEHPYPGALNTMAFDSSGFAFSSPSWIIQHCNGTALTPGVSPGSECEYTTTNPPPGTGPFKVVEVTPKVRVVLERYDNYWGGPDHTGPSKLKRFIMEYVPEIGTRELDLYAGTTDAIELPASNAFDIIDKDAWLNSHQIKPLKPGIRVWTAPTIEIFAVTLNPRFKPLDDVRFRQALAYSFPYDEFINQAMNGFGVKLGGLIPKGMLGYQSDLDSYYTYSPDKAKALFQQVGYKGSLEFTVRTGNPVQESVALLWETSLKDLAGITVTIREVDTATDLTLYHEFKEAAMVGHWSQDIDDPAPFLADYATPAGFHSRAAMFNNDTITKMMNEAASSLDPATRISLYREIQLEMLRKVPDIDLAVPVAVFAERDWVLPSDSAIGRSIYYPLAGDGDAGLTGGYARAYEVSKAQTTSQINVDIQPVLGAISEYLITTTTSVRWLSEVLSQLPFFFSELGQLVVASYS